MIDYSVKCAQALIACVAAAGPAILGCSEQVASEGGGPNGETVASAAVEVRSSPTAASQAPSPRYHYVALNEATLPAGIVSFGPIAINNSGRVYGNAIDGSSRSHVAVYEGGVVTLLQPLQPGTVNVVNQRGTVGGVALVGPGSATRQAALFSEAQVVLIPFRPNEFRSAFVALNDSNTGVVASFEAPATQTLSLYENGQTTPLDLGSDIPNAVTFPPDINNAGIVVGIKGRPFIDARGFRFDTHTAEMTLLPPRSSETVSWALRINNGGDVLGYSFNGTGGTEVVGVWNHQGTFTPYFVEGTPEFPTISNKLVFNDRREIVITQTNDGNSYLVPEPFVRLNLADLVDTLPLVPTPLARVSGMNNKGDIVGSGSSGNAFLLTREGNGP